MASYNDPAWSGAFAPGSQDPLISGDGSDDWFYDMLNNSVEIVINPDEDALSTPAQFSAQSPTFPAPWNLGFPPSPQFTFQVDTNQFNDCPPLMQTPRLTPVFSESPAADVCPVIEDPDSSSSGEAEIRTTRREKKCEKGYPCRHPGCNKVFDRAGDARKHARRTHTPNAQRRHTCPHCPKRFNWPKDVKRHFDNVHSGDSHALVRSDPKIRLDPRFGGNMAPAASPTGCLMGLFLMAIRTRKLVIRMRARRQSQSSANRRFVMVTRDGTNFRAVEVTAAKSSSMLVDTIAQAHKLPGMSQVQLSTYSLGSGVTQRRPSLDKLFTMISQASMGNAPMQLLLEPVIKEEMTDD